MTEINTPSPTPPNPFSAAFSDERQMAMVIYALFLLGFVTAWVTPIVGLVLAHLNRDTAPEWMKSHYAFQIRTFWLGVLYFAVAFASLLVLIGIVAIPAVAVWFIVRCAVGMNHLLKKEPYPTPESWTI